MQYPWWQSIPTRGYWASARLGNDHSTIGRKNRQSERLSPTLGTITPTIGPCLANNHCAAIDVTRYLWLCPSSRQRTTPRTAHCCLCACNAMVRQFPNRTGESLPTQEARVSWRCVVPAGATTGWIKMPPRRLLPSSHRVKDFYRARLENQGEFPYISTRRR